MTDLDIHDPAVYLLGVPHDRYARLRAEAPVWWQAEPDGPRRDAALDLSNLTSAPSEPPSLRRSRSAFPAKSISGFA